MIPGVIYGIRRAVAMTAHGPAADALKARDTSSKEASKEASKEEHVAEVSSRAEDLLALRVALRKRALACATEKQMAREVAAAEVARRFREWRDWAHGKEGTVARAGATSASS